MYTYVCTYMCVSGYVSVLMCYCEYMYYFMSLFLHPCYVATLQPDLYLMLMCSYSCALTHFYEALRGSSYA